MSSQVLDHPHHAPTVNLTKFGMITFLASEAMLFAGLISAYVILWLSKGSAYEPEWLKEDHFSWPILMTGINTVILLGSSFTLYKGEQAVLKNGNTTLWLLVTTLMGAVFVTVQGFEWTHLYHEHIWAGSAGTYSSSFFALTGFHGLHVSIGVFFLAVTTLMSAAGRFTPHRHDFMTCISLYWHFVDVVWVLLFTIMYVLPYFIR